MTIYTDQVTGKKYDRVLGGVATVAGHIEGSETCHGCSFDGRLEACLRAIDHCTGVSPNKTAFFLFKERKA